MKQSTKIEWVLRIAVAGEFIGHGVLAIQGKRQWIEWVQAFAGVSTSLSTQLLFLVGVMDIVLALIVLLKPVRMALLWATFWGFWTALIRPIMGEPVWDFIERAANWGAPLALLLLLGWPRRHEDWWKN